MRDVEPRSNRPQPQVIDFHCHLIPAVDDGARSIEESEAAVAEMQRHMVKTIVTTPHLSASSLNTSQFREYLGKVDNQFSVLTHRVSRVFPTLTLERGFEILLDVPRVDLTDPKLRLAATRFALVEFPWAGLPIESARALFEIRTGGYIPIVAHPERYRDMDRKGGIAESWHNSGALLQVNQASLLGGYGKRAEALAWTLLERGIVSYLCTDYHARGECPVTPAKKKLAARSGSDELAHLLMAVNPARMLADSEPLAAPPLARARVGWWQRFKRARSGS